MTLLAVCQMWPFYESQNYFSLWSRPSDTALYTQRHVFSFHTLICAQFDYIILGTFEWVLWASVLSFHTSFINSPTKSAVFFVCVQHCLFLFFFFSFILVHFNVLECANCIKDRSIEITHTYNPSNNINIESACIIIYKILHNAIIMSWHMDVNYKSNI